MTDDGAVVVERDAVGFTGERGSEEDEAGGIGRHGVPKGHPSAVAKHSGLAVESMGAHGRFVR